MNLYQHLIKETTDEWHEAKHRKTSQEELDFLDSLKPICCPKCGSKEISKNGKRASGLQTFICRDHNKKFTVLTNTIFDFKKIPISEWIEYLIHLLQYHSINSATDSNQNVHTTVYYRLEKVFLVLKNCQENILLNGEVYIGEFFFICKYGFNKKNNLENFNYYAVFLYGMKTYFSHPSYTLKTIKNIKLKKVQIFFKFNH